MTRPDDFKAIEIDPIDLKLEATAKRKRIPTLRLQPETEQAPESKSEKLGGLEKPEASTNATAGQTSDPEPARRPKPQSARKRPLSLEVPDYLARELKIKAATDAVTVRYLVLSALSAAGYRVDDDELEEDGRRLR